jgi:hypothetical protein
MMRKTLAHAVIAILVLGMMVACKPGLLPTSDAGKPKITLERIEVVSSFPWVDPPGRTPLALGFVFNIHNPSSQNIMLDNLKFAYSFEVKPDYYVEMNIPVSYDRIYFPPQTTSQYRITNIIDSAVVNGKLLVTQGDKLQSIGVKPVEVMKNWYEKIGDFAFGIKVSEGMAVFASEKGEVFIPFEGKFPQK